MTPPIALSRATVEALREFFDHFQAPFTLPDTLRRLSLSAMTVLDADLKAAETVVGPPLTWPNAHAQAEWLNIEGALIPAWLQGRGSGQSGGTLHIAADGLMFTVRPGDKVVYVEDARTAARRVLDPERARLANLLVHIASQLDTADITAADFRSAARMIREGR